MYHYTDGPPQRVVGQWLQGSQTPHGDAVAIHDIEGLTETLCKTFVQKPRALSRTEFRYIRTSGLLLSQAALGSALGVDAQTVARWEKDKHIPKMADKMIRLIYLEHANGNVRLKSAFETRCGEGYEWPSAHPSRRGIQRGALGVAP
jgi:DNA-binding transcriptional regulator YiaG